MSKLPNTQPPTNDDSVTGAPNGVLDDDNSVIPVKSGGIFGGKPTAESSFIPETPAPSETQKSPESIPTPTPPQPKEFKKSTEEALPPIEQTEPIQNVVDKTEQITTLHEIKSTKDKLTKEADEEEEHFIEEVEKHHGDL